MRDKLLGAVIGLARAAEGNEELLTEATDRVLKEGLTATMTDSVFDDTAYQRLYDRIMEEKKRIIPSCFTCAYPCGRTDNFDMQELWNMEPDVRSLKTLLLSGMQMLASKDATDQETIKFLYKGLLIIGIYWDAEGLLPFLTELGEIMYKKECAVAHSRAERGR